MKARPKYPLSEWGDDGRGVDMKRGYVMMFMNLSLPHPCRRKIKSMLINISLRIHLLIHVKWMMKTKWVVAAIRCGLKADGIHQLMKVFEREHKNIYTCVWKYRAISISILANGVSEYFSRSSCWLNILESNEIINSLKCLLTLFPFPSSHPVLLPLIFLFLCYTELVNHDFIYGDYR